MAIIPRATRTVAYELLARAAASSEDENDAKGSSKGSSSGSGSSKSPTSKVEKYTQQANQWINTHVSLVLAACLVGLASVIVGLVGLWWCLKYKHRKQLLAQEQEELEEGRAELDKMGMPEDTTGAADETGNGMYPHFGAQQPPEVQISFADVQHDPSQYYEDGGMKQDGMVGPNGYTMNAISERTEEQDYNSQGKQTRVDEDDDEEDLNSQSYPANYGQQVPPGPPQEPASPPQYVVRNDSPRYQVKHSRGLSDPRDAYYGDQPGLGIPQPQHMDRDSMYSVQEKTRYV